MRLLIDTHNLIYFLEGNNLLTHFHQKIITDPNNEVFVSIASLWEIAIKISIGKLTLTKPLEDVIQEIDHMDFKILPISPEHALQVSTMPFHHRDPFDRIIIAQSQVENLAIISNDKSFPSYKVTLL